MSTQTPETTVPTTTPVTTTETTVPTTTPVQLTIQSPLPISGSYTVNDINAATFIKYFSRYLRRTGKIELPKYVDTVKTGRFCYNGPANPDWYYVRAASIVRKVYLTPGVGVGALRHIYGALNRRSKGRKHHTPASGAIIRHVFHQLEKLQLIEKTPNGGRRVTKIGRRDLDRISAQIGKRIRQI
eukprot:TRINITY_DN315_c0_g1_i1.p1 TRINITY_DN315_c0_g1~~TRINITY_DN315_c0_g1_i1.p1  ORF type:complete len:185 (-),score=41.05 TRINITY_DN315_c0_g1_i1:86-640(-)